MIEIDNTGVSELKKITTKIEEITKENKEIEAFFQQIDEFRKAIIDQNK